MAKNKAAEKAAEEILSSVIPEEERQKKTPLLENRGLAVCLTVLAILLGMVIGSHRSVQKQAQKVERGFTQGIQYKGFSIAGDLADRMEYAQNLMKIAQRYDLSTGEVSVAIMTLKRAKGPAEKYDANFMLTGAVDALNGAMLQEELTEKDSAYRGELHRNFVSCNDTISHEAVLYNMQVEKFNREILTQFPTGTLARLTGVDELEAYQ